MPNGDRPRPRRALVALAFVVILLATTGVVIQFTVSERLGHQVIGCAVLGAITLSVLGLRKRPT